MQLSRACKVTSLLIAATVFAACSSSTPESTSTATDSAATTDSAASTVSVATTPVTSGASTSEPADSTPAATTTLPPATFEIASGVEQVTITGAEPNTELNIISDTGEVLSVGVADTNGALIVRRLEGGVVVHAADAGSQTEPVKVMGFDETPPPSFYAEQRLPDQGLGYITARDGTTLSASVWLPGPVDGGPYPTVVEYSGYSPSDPNSVGFPQVFTTLGYAYIGVNMRGTGCSGGSYRYFEPSQSTDGYDAIEVVAAQPWVANHKVGMVGVSYPGISQLFVAQTQPPSLAAITPLSVIADSYRSTLYPGGLLNTGFAVDWMSARLEEAKPSGQAWAADAIAAGDETCAANQSLRLQNPDIIAEIENNSFWTDDEYASLAPRLFVDRINVPTFIAGAWQDEQTGGEFANMLDDFTGTEHLYATLMNGLHIDSISPAVFPRFAEFLDIYVADRTPSPDAVRVVMPVLASQLTGATLDAETVNAITPDRFAGMSPEEARAAFEEDPPIELLFEDGAADGTEPQSPLPRYRTGLAAWPPPSAVDTAFALGADGVLYDGELPDNAPAEATGEVTYLALPDATPKTYYTGNSGVIGRIDTSYDWQQGGNGTFAGYLTEPLASDLTIAGSASADLWITSNLDDTDLEVTISEVLPNGDEVYVQSGWLRASERTLNDAESTPIYPFPTFLKDDASLLPSEPTEVRVPILPFAHTFRTGSRLRLSVDAPGGNRPVWVLETIAKGEQVTIASGADTPSKLVVAALPAGTVEVPADPPACGSLRGQPCRKYPG